jgi:hypothetical protein
MFFAGMTGKAGVCSFLALVLRKELEDRLAAAGHSFEWADIVQDLERLSETEIECAIPLPVAPALCSEPSASPCRRSFAAPNRHRPRRHDQNRVAGLAAVVPTLEPRPPTP